MALVSRLGRPDVPSPLFSVCRQPHHFRQWTTTPVHDIIHPPSWWSASMSVPIHHAQHDCFYQSLSGIRHIWPNNCSFLCTLSLMLLLVILSFRHNFSILWWQRISNAISFLISAREKLHSRESGGGLPWRPSRLFNPHPVRYCLWSRLFVCLFVIKITGSRQKTIIAKIGMCGIDFFLNFCSVSVWFLENSDSAS